MRTIILIFLAAFLITSTFTLKGKTNTRKNVTLLLRQDSTENKLSLLKKLSEALKFRKNAHEREKKRVIKIIDDYVKAAAATPNYTEFALNSMNTKLADLQSIINKIQADIETIRPLVPFPVETDPSDPIAPKPSPEPAAPNNDKYIDDLIKAIYTQDKPPVEPISLPKQERLALIKNLILEPIVLHDTVDKIFKRERTVKLKHAAEVWGFYPYTNREIDLNYRLYNALVINAYELNGNTGRSLKDLDLKNFEVSRRAKVIGSKLIMGVTADAKNTSDFLQRGFAQSQFISEIIVALSENHMDGLNIQFKGLNAKLSKPMLAFMENLSKACRKGSKQFTLSITIPDFDLKEGYLLTDLSPLTDRFLVDFSQQDFTNRPGPLAPLKQQSDYSIETCVSRYLNTSHLAPSKLILLLPYYGIRRTFDSKGKAENATLLSYSRIRANYQYLPVNYDEQTATAIIEVLDTAGKVREKIWFDNEHTLDKKYDFAIKGGLAGVAIRDMTADIGYGELADELAFKFLLPDTLTTKLTNLEIENQKFGWPYIVRNLKTYYFLLGNPCHPSQYILDRTLLTYIIIILAIICLGLGLFCFSKIRTKGDEWTNRTSMLIVMGIVAFTLITCSFAWLYLDKDIPWFGLDNKCIDMPFLILYMIILAGIALGILLMRLFLFPIIRREDTP